MKSLILLIITFIVIAVSCTRANNKMLQGFWKIEKVEIMKGSELKRTIIDSADQYWSIRDRKWLYIFNGQKVQNRLPVKLLKGGILSYDTLTGSLQDEFVVERSTEEKLELVSRKTIAEDHYDIIYYLDKVDDQDIPRFIDGY